MELKVITLGYRKMLFADLAEPGIKELMVMYKEHKPVMRGLLTAVLMGLYEKIKHGDEAHQKWLLDKINEYNTNLLQ